MKKQILTVIAIVLAIAVNSTAFGQDNMSLQKSKTKSNQSNDKSATSPQEVCKVKLRTTPTGCEIVFTNELVSPRDAASGMATGKRQHKPVRIAKELDKSSPLLARSSNGNGNGNLGVGKVSMQDVTCTITSKGRTTKVPVRNNQFTMPEGIDNDCDMVLSWTWGISTSSATERCECPLQVTMENGACLAINSKGTSAK